MKKFFILLLSITTQNALQAQTGKAYQVPPGERVSQTLQKAKALYQYPQFSIAQVAFKNGNAGGGRMNYNRLLNEMEFIDGKGDTLAIDNSKEVAYIAFGRDTFFFADGYLQLIDAFGTRVAKKTVLEQTDRRAVGGMGEQNAGGTTTYTSLSNQQGIKDLVPNEVRTFSETTTYYISDKFNRFKPLNRKSLHNLYAKKEKEVEAYLQANPVNFSQEADVLRLISFLKTL